MTDPELFDFWNVQPIGCVSNLNDLINEFSGYWLKRREVALVASELNNVPFKPPITSTPSLTITTSTPSSSQIVMPESHSNPWNNPKPTPKKTKTANKYNKKMPQSMSKLIQSGAPLSVIKAVNPEYFISKYNSILSTWIGFKNNLRHAASPCNPISTQIQPEYSQLLSNPASKAAVDIYMMKMVRKIKSKGNNIIYMFGQSNAGKTTLVKKGYGATVKIDDLLFHNGWYVYMQIYIYIYIYIYTYI